MKNRVKIIVFLSVVLFPVFCFANSVPEIVKMFRKLESKCEIGISYNEYVNIISILHYEVKELYKDDQDPKGGGWDYLARVDLTLSLECHKTALDLWRYSRECKQDDWISVRNRCFELIEKTSVTLFPGCRKRTKEGGIMVGDDYLSMTAVLSQFWKEAKKSTDEAEMNYNRSKGKAKGKKR